MLRVSGATGTLAASRRLRRLLVPPRTAAPPVLRSLRAPGILGERPAGPVPGVVRPLPHHDESPRRSACGRGLRSGGPQIPAPGQDRAAQGVAAPHGLTARRRRASRRAARGLPVACSGPVPSLDRPAKGLQPFSRVGPSSFQDPVYPPLPRAVMPANRPGPSRQTTHRNRALGDHGEAVPAAQAAGRGEAPAGRRRDDDGSERRDLRGPAQGVWSEGGPPGRMGEASDEVKSL